MNEEQTQALLAILYDAERSLRVLSLAELAGDEELKGKDYLVAELIELAEKGKINI